MYHYVRDLPKTPFPRLKGMMPDAFAMQIANLQRRYEVATLEAALDFLAGRYRPARDLVLLTFDDGLKEHFTEVTPLLAEHGIQGLFFLPTAGVGDHRVLAVHKSHFLMALLDFAEYRRAFLEVLDAMSVRIDPAVDAEKARNTYRWDTQDVASFKYLVNFGLPSETRLRALDALFASHLGDEAQFARGLYVSWDEARQMQSVGMLIGGHSHEHLALATLSTESWKADLQNCMGLLRQNLAPQPAWPFSYPYGKPSSFNADIIGELQKLGVCCSFGTEVGANSIGQDLFNLCRFDPKDLAA